MKQEKDEELEEEFDEKSYEISRPIDAGLNAKEEEVIGALPAPGVFLVNGLCSETEKFDQCTVIKSEKDTGGILSRESQSDSSACAMKECNICGHQAIDQVGMEHHLCSNRNDKKNFSCDQCKFSADNKGGLKRHIRRVHLLIREYSCNLCEFKASDKSNLNQHIKGVHLRTKKYSCDSCDFKAGRKNGLAEHVERVHLKLKNHRCEQCDHETYSKAEMASHVRSIHEVQSEKKFECDICQYKTLTKPRLDRHVRSVHLKVSNYKCDYCNFKAYSRSYVTRHIRHVHCNVKEFQCNLCSIRKINQSSLNQHIEVVHLKAKHFACEQCSYKTYGQYHLNEHIEAKHLNLRKFRCYLCDYRSNYKARLNSHIRKKHANGASFCNQSDLKISKSSQRGKSGRTARKDVHHCRLCSFKTHTKVSLTKHIKNTHSIEDGFGQSPPEVGQNTVLPVDENKTNVLMNENLSCSHREIGVSLRLRPRKTDRYSYLNDDRVNDTKDDRFYHDTNSKTSGKLHENVNERIVGSSPEMVNIKYETEIKEELYLYECSNEQNS